MKIKNKSSGIINIPLTIALSAGVLTVGGVTAFWQTARNTDAKINATQIELNKEVSLTNQRVSVVETQVSSILSGQERLEEKIDELLKELNK